MGKKHNLPESMYPKSQTNLSYVILISKNICTTLQTSTAHHTRFNVTPYHRSRGLIVTKRESMAANKTVPVTKQATKMYHVCSSKISVNAGNWAYNVFIIFRSFRP